MAIRYFISKQEINGNEKRIGRKAGYIAYDHALEQAERIFDRDGDTIAIDMGELDEQGNVEILERLEVLDIADL